MSNTPAAAPEKQDNLIKRVLKRIDSFQQAHSFSARTYGLIKKYGDDEAGKQAALITYYGFLSLFPLLIVAVSVVDLISQHDAHLRSQLLMHLNDYFPIVGKQLQSNVHGSGKTGAALIIGLIITLYGARGIADQIRSAFDHVWAIPKAARVGFPKAALKSLALLLGAGIGMLVTSILAGYATGVADHSFFFRLIPITLNMVLLYGIVLFVFRIGISSKRTTREVTPGAVLAAIGLFILQTVGGYLITHQLQSLQGLYGQFALVLAILFWIYLQAEVLLYAAELNTVLAYDLWPRSLTQDPLTAADKKAFKLYASREAYRPHGEEEIDVSFKKTV